MADKISMSQRALPKVSQRYIPHNVTFKNDRNGLHFMTSASLRLGTGNNEIFTSLIFLLAVDDVTMIDTWLNINV